MTALRQHRGLIAILVVSLVLLGVSRYAVFLWIRPYFLLQVLTALQNVACEGVCASVAIVAALAPQRRFTGLIWATAFAMAVVVAIWLADSFRLPVPARPHLWYLADTLSVFVVAQGLRFLFGWRLTNESVALRHRTGQFRVIDVLEWTTSVGVFLAFWQLLEMPPQETVSVLPLLVENVLVSLPFALLATRERGLTWNVAGTCRAVGCGGRYCGNPCRLFVH